LGLNPFEGQSSESHVTNNNGKHPSVTMGTGKETLQLLANRDNPHPLPGIIMEWRSVTHSLNKVSL